MSGEGGAALTVWGVGEHGDGGALQVIILCLKQLLILISLTQTMTTEGDRRKIYYRIRGISLYS